MRSTKLAKTLAALTLTAGTLAALPAHAHITMQGALKSRGGDQKSSPCDGSRGDGPVYMFEPGTVITLSASEDVPHPSYFRIAFDNDRDDNFIEPKSIKPIDPGRACPVDSKDQCGQSDFCNVMSTTGGATVLWDNIDPHLAGGAKTWTWTIKLPDVECENCTIQVLQIMEDDLFHGAYCPTGSCTDSSLEDIYHRCIDITLKKGATNSPGVATGPVSVKGMECSPSTVPTAGTGAGGMSGTGGAAAGAGGVAGAAIGAGASGGAAGAGAAGIGMGSSANTGAGAGGTAATAGAAAPGAAGRAAGAAGGVGIVTPPTPAGSGATTAGSMAVAGAPAPTSGAPAPGPSSDGGCSVTSLGQTQASAAAWLLLMAALVFVRRRHAR